MASQQELWADPFLHLTDVALYRKRMQLEDLREAVALRREVAALSDDQLRIYNQDEKALDNDPVYHGSVDERVRILMYGRALPQQVYEAILAEEGKPAESMADVGVAMIYANLPPGRTRIARKLFLDLAVFFPPLEQDRYLLPPVSPQERIGYALYHYRQNRQLPQREVAQKLGISTSTISRLETGNADVSFSDDLISRVAELLAMPQERVVEGVSANRAAPKPTSVSLSLEQHEFLRLYRHLPAAEREGFLNNLSKKVQMEEKTDGWIRAAFAGVGKIIPVRQFQR